MGDSRNEYEFSKDVILQLGNRVNLHCSMPDCRAPTKGPHSTDPKAISVGTASHIHAAAKGGPRYDPNQTDDQRRSLENGIWLCATHGRLIDTDALRFPAPLLRAWKANAELEASESIGKPRPATSSDDQGALQMLILEIERVKGLADGGPSAKYNFASFDNLLPKVIALIAKDHALLHSVKNMRSWMYDADSGAAPSATMAARNIFVDAERALAGLNKLLSATGTPLSAAAVTVPLHEVELTLAFKTLEKTPIPYPTLHRYELRTTVNNTGPGRIDEWFLEVEFPTRMLEPKTPLIGLVTTRSNNDVTLLRLPMEPLHHADEYTHRLLYRVDDAIFEQKHVLFSKMVRARVFINGTRFKEVERVFDDLQNF